MRIVSAGIPSRGIHVRNRCGRDDNFPSGYNPVLDIDRNSIWHSYDVKVHPEPQRLSIDGLQERQANQLVNVEPNTAFLIFRHAGIHLCPYTSEERRVSIDLKNGPERCRDGVS
jgi:hypothetical protein